MLINFVLGPFIMGVYERKNEVSLLLLERRMQ